MCSTAVAVRNPVAVALPETATPVRGLPLPWRDPSTVSKANLAIHIRNLELACDENPRSVDLKTCLGIAYAMNYDAYKSMDVLQAAVDVDPAHFFAQLKLSELLYRLRTLPKAEEETLKAVELAGNLWELSLAKKQLQEIRRLIREGSQRPEFSKSLKTPVLVFVAMSVVFSLLMTVIK